MRRKIKFAKVVCGVIQPTALAKAKAKDPRMYEEEWKILKDTGALILSVSTQYHHRIRRMIQKEKNLDAEFHFNCKELRITSHLVSKSVKGILEFRLIVF